MISIKQKLALHRKLFISFIKIGTFVFGGGYAMLPIIQREVVNHHQWISEKDFIDMLAVTQSAPGPVAVNTSIFTGYKVARLSGAVTALIGVVLPPFTIILLLATFLSSYSDNYYLIQFFAGVRPAIVGLILGVGLKTGKNIIHTSLDFFLAVLALILLLVLGLHPFLIIILGALSGLLYSYCKKSSSQEDN
ncbi:MAG: chromate transporter [Clostridia bacterium]|nr:chromate transporter [Clostridia bacterium]